MYCYELVLLLLAAAEAAAAAEQHWQGKVDFGTLHEY